MKVRSVLAVALFSTLLVGAAGLAQAACTSWDLNRDYNGENPIYDACGRAVWSFKFQVPDSVPADYPLLPGYYPLTDHHRDPNFPSMDQWDVDSQVYHSDYCDSYFMVCLPEVGKNLSPDPLVITYLLTVPGNTVTFHPGDPQRTVVAWRSPFSGYVSVAATFTLFDFGSNGVNYHVAKNSTEIASGFLSAGLGSTYATPRIAVSPGTNLYFSVDANGSLYNDTTGLSVIIRKVK
jgi:hypothetical protein